MTGSSDMAHEQHVASSEQYSSENMFIMNIIARKRDVNCTVDNLTNYKGAVRK
jgi:hypothetical protein